MKHPRGIERIDEACVSVKAKCFTVTVIQIQQRRYVETPRPDLAARALKAPDLHAGTTVG